MIITKEMFHDLKTLTEMHKDYSTITITDSHVVICGNYDGTPDKFVAFQWSDSFKSWLPDRFSTIKPEEL